MFNIIIFLLGAGIMFFMALRSVLARRRLCTQGQKVTATVEGTVQTLQQNARQKDDFVAAFTHELKTPMTSILGFADILRSGEVSPATRRTAADYIYHESKRLEALSGNLLALMGLEQQPPQLEAVPLGRVLQSLRRALPQASSSRCSAW